jgi:hypothetical protein
MDVTATVVTIGGVILIFATLWFFFGKPKTAGKAATGKVKTYSCPMHPWITSADPTATCSICGMKLVLNETG